MGFHITSRQPPVPELRHQADQLIRDAFEAGRQAGFKQAEEELSQRITALSAELQASFAKATEVLNVPMGALQAQASLAAAPTVTTNTGQNSDGLEAYGAKKKAVRTVMASAPPGGLKMADVKERVQHKHGVVLATSQVREALSALRQDGEVVCVDRTWWQATAKLSERSTNENGALNGVTASAPETGGAPPPSVESRARESMFD